MPEVLIALSMKRFVLPSSIRSILNLGSGLPLFSSGTIEGAYRVDGSSLVRGSSLVDGNSLAGAGFCGPESCDTRLKSLRLAEGLTSSACEGPPPAVRFTPNTGGGFGAALPGRWVGEAFR